MNAVIDMGHIGHYWVIKKGDGSTIELFYTSIWISGSCRSCCVASDLETPGIVSVCLDHG